jgi:micrococcal nuclease
MRRAVAVAVLLVLGTGCARSSATDVATKLKPGEATVVRVVDGDTIVVRLASGEEKVRLIGVDTPEETKPDTPVECYAVEAAERTKQLLPPGTLVRLERDKEARDRYGRLLAYVTRAGDGLSIEVTLLQEGFAATLAIKPNTTHEAEYARLAAEAQRTGTGLWAACGGPHVVR